MIITVGADTTATAELVAEYITALKEILQEFQSTPDDIDDDNDAGQAVIDEMVNLKSELLSIKTYCQVNAAVAPIPDDVIAENFMP